MIVDFGNATLHKYVVQKGKDLLRLVQKWLCIHFLFLSRIHIKSVLKIPVPLMSEWMQEGQYGSLHHNSVPSEKNSTLSKSLFECASNCETMQTHNPRSVSSVQRACSIYTI